MVSSTHELVTNCWDTQSFLPKKRCPSKVPQKLLHWLTRHPGLFSSKIQSFVKSPSAISLDTDPPSLVIKAEPRENGLLLRLFHVVTLQTN